MIEQIKNNNSILDSIVTRNAVIVSTSLNIDQFGMLTAWIQVKHAIGNQGFGGFCLYRTASDKEIPHVIDFSGLFIQRCLEVSGAGNWENIVGKNIRILHDWGKIYTIGHIIEDDWFSPAEDFELYRKIKFGDKNL